MKTILVVAIALLVVAASAEDVFRPGRRVKPRALADASKVCKAEPASDTSKNGKKYCGDDTVGECDALGYYTCTGDGTGTLTACEDDFPYCKETTAGAATCTSTANSACPLKPGAFDCPSKGIFPDPTNCHKYYNCWDAADDGKIVADPYTCDDQFVFDPSDPTKTRKYCRLTSNRYCTQIICPVPAATKNFLLSYQFFPSSMGQIVATCRKVGTPVVTWCKAGFLADTTSAPAGCIFQCTRAIKAEFDGDDTRYNECKWNGRAWVASVEKCFQPGTFDPLKLVCVPKTT